MRAIVYFGNIASMSNTKTLIESVIGSSEKIEDRLHVSGLPDNINPIFGWSVTFSKFANSDSGK
jgi:hypothetical protein